MFQNFQPLPFSLAVHILSLWKTLKNFFVHKVVENELHGQRIKIVFITIFYQGALCSFLNIYDCHLPSVPWIEQSTVHDYVQIFVQEWLLEMVWRNFLAIAVFMVVVLLQITVYENVQIFVQEWLLEMVWRNFLAIGYNIKYTNHITHYK